MKINNSPKGAIFVATYSRAQDLDRCLRNIVIARGTEEIPLIIIHQYGVAEVSDVIRKWRNEIQILIETDAQGKTPLQNINLNSLLGREVAFTWLGSDWCLGVEDDVQISSDAIKFIEVMFNKYRKNPFFRGVNLGSKLVFKKEEIASYAKVSFGMHGQASMITKRTWNHFNSHKLRYKSNTMGLDAMMEHFTKTGFMCTPYNSRYLDNGWNGTHSSSNPNDPHYQAIRESYFERQTTPPEKYILKKFENRWREDSLTFSYFRIVPILMRNKLGHYRYLLKSRILR